MLCIGVFFTFQLSTFNSAQAQDQHFSMLDLDPLLFNPAYSGFFDGKGRFGVVYRNQWASVSTPFQTVSASVEIAIARSTRNMNGFSGGLWVTADRAGSLGYGTTAASAIASYFQGLGDGTNIVSVAVEAGVGQVGFDAERLDMSDGTETFARTRIPYPALGAGVAWFCQLSDAVYTKVGVAVRNINEPDVSASAISTDGRLSRRFNIYGRAEWRMTSQWGLLPVVGYQRQRGFSELVYGCDARLYLRDDPSNYLALSAGLMGRHGDAASVDIAVMWHEWTFAFSYDANLSRLASASHTLGAFEIGVVYMLANRTPKRTSLPCPIF